MAKKTLNVGLIGYKFMGKAHSNAYRQVNRYFDLPVDVNLHTICGRNTEAVSQAAAKFGWGHIETDWRRLIENPEIDIVDVSTPGDSHCEIACAAAAAGKAVFCEKPIGNTLDEARQMLEAVECAGVPHAVFHNYRKSPAIGLAKRMLEDGRVGRVFHVRAVYLQDWIVDPNFPLVWRLQREHSGSGSLGDIGSHIIDLARFLLGEFEEVCGMVQTFIAERPLLAAADDRLGGTASREMGTVTVDDAAAFLAKMESGVFGTFEATRFATGRKNHNRIEINGDTGSLVFNLERMNELEYYSSSDPDDARGFRTIQATESVHPYAGAYWPPGHIIGYEHTFVNLLADALLAMHEGREISPNLRDGFENQRVMDAVERSASSKQWISLNAGPL